jgi:hypothetical protein
MSTWEEFVCPKCAKSFDVRIDLSFDRPIVVYCPYCGDEQRHEIKDGYLVPVRDS